MQNSEKPMRSMDPFAQRNGLHLSWKNLDMEVKSRTKTGNTKILRNVSGEASPGELTCIIGQSGSGKSSLLHYLAGRIEPSRRMQIQGSIYLDGKKMDPHSTKLQSKVAYTEQRDTLMATATPREAIYFSARLRLPRSVSDREIEMLTDKILDQLRLSKVADSLIGGEHIRGLSGGEIRRVSLGVQLVVCPSIVLLDEVTSGLDSRNAAVVMQICKDVARAGASVLMVLHQPSSEIFSLMDKLMVLDHGRCMYHGKASKAVEHFASMGFDCPSQFNPAEWILKIALEESSKAPEESIIFSKDLAVEESSSLLSDDERTEVSASTAASAYDAKAPGANAATQLLEQGRRDVRAICRDANGTLMRFGMIVASSVLSAITFTNVGKDSLENPSAFGSHVGALFFLLLGTTLILQLTLFDFIGVRDLYIKEIRTKHYNLLTFGITKVSLDSCLTFVQATLLVLITYWALGLHMRLWYFIMIMFALTMVNVSMSYLLGSIPKDPRLAKEFIALIILPQILFSGFFVTPESLPVWISWLSYLMPTTYAFRLVLADEFAQCLDFPPMQQQLLNCLKAMEVAEQSGLGDLAHVSAFASEDITVTVAETGTFKGTSSAVEYLSLLSPEDGGFFLKDPCAVQGSRSLFFYPSEEANQCTFVRTSVQQVSIEDRYLPESAAGGPLLEAFQADKIQFSVSEDLQSIQLSSLSAYIPQAFYDTILEENVESSKAAAKVCQTMEDLCPSTWEFNGFEGQQECIETMSNLPTTTVNIRGQTTIDGNSTGCRVLHENLVHKDTSHCPHLSFFPQEDRNGQIKCSAGYELDPKDIFTPQDFAKMMMAAEEAGFNATALDRAVRPISERSACQHTTDPVGPEAFRHLPLPMNLFCAQYLETQNATGSNDTTYWIVLLVMFVVLRVASMFALKVRALNRIPGISGMLRRRLIANDGAAETNSRDKEILKVVKVADNVPMKERVEFEV